VTIEPEVWSQADEFFADRSGTPDGKVASKTDLGWSALAGALRTVVLGGIVFHMPDPTMSLAFEVGRQLSEVTELPQRLRRVKARARLVSGVNPPINWTPDTAAPGDWPWRFQVTLDNQSGILLVRLTPGVSANAWRLLPEIVDESERLSLSLRLWAGCIDGAKTIALGTRSGRNTPEIRRVTAGMIAQRAAVDPIYAAGARAAAAFKHFVRQSVGWVGVPKDSILRPPVRVGRRQTSVAHPSIR
jgi:hypothetical protein